MWQNKQLRKLESLTSLWDNEQLKCYKIEKLKVYIHIIQEESETCETCKMYQSTIERIIRNLETDYSIGEYNHMMTIIKTHLIKDHEYVNNGSSLFMLVALGISLGAVIGSFLYNDWLVLGIVGSIIGITIGIMIESKHLTKKVRV